MRSKTGWTVTAWTVLIVFLVAVLGALSLLFPLRPEITPGGSRLDIEERDVLTEVPSSYSPEFARFAVRFKDIVNPYRVLAAFVLPGETMDIEVLSPSDVSSYTIEADSSAAIPAGPRRWIWRAPAVPGTYALHIDEVTTGSSVTINVFVKTPYAVTANALNGYAIGRYETTPLNGDSLYLPPRGFVEVTPENQDILVSPHFTLGDFLCKQASDYPKYVLVREPLLLKLEWLLREVNEREIEARTLHVMSAFRTPFYNRLIGNTTSYSRHLYGGAADVFVDSNDDGYMDDLNGDGTVDRGDAAFMAQMIEEMGDGDTYEPLFGGLGIYAPAPHRGPFIHVDVRGRPVRW